MLQQHFSGFWTPWKAAVCAQALREFTDTGELGECARAQGRWAVHVRTGGGHRRQPEPCSAQQRHNCTRRTVHMLGNLNAFAGLNALSSSGGVVSVRLQHSVRGTKETIHLRVCYV